MIYAFTGKTGSGKTFNMVRHAYKRWLNGTDIYSNTVLFFEQKRKGFNYIEIAFHHARNLGRRLFKMEPKPLKRGRITHFEEISEIQHAKDGLILFDEGQVLFSARQWEDLPFEFSYKLQQHRKHQLDLFTTTQNMGTIDIMYRRLVQRWFHHETVFQMGKTKSWFGLFRIKEKDIDFLYNSVDDLQVPDIKIRYFMIHRFSRRLYDTFFDIGFKRFKTIWIRHWNEQTNRVERKGWILPKEMSLKDGQRLLSSLESDLGLKKLKTLR